MKKISPSYNFFLFRRKTAQHIKTLVVSDSFMHKAALHTHVRDVQELWVKYDAFQLIDHAAKKKFRILAITSHDSVIFSPKLKNYAHEKNILLIPGAELTLEGRHVLVYNLTEKERRKITTIRDLRTLSKPKHLIAAPHPFFVSPKCLGKLTEQFIDIF
ncbi:hypothetical protein COY95_02200, partial [Candidatus Woesearchaeota archaeon CG_4_10_14_0_8_um_filter_47_5]